jgi:hypothetical protein
MCREVPVFEISRSRRQNAERLHRAVDEGAWRERAGDCLYAFRTGSRRNFWVKSYPVAAVVHADMMFADAAGGWALIGKSGDVVPLWHGVELDRDPQFARFVAKHQGATLWADSIDWPKASLLDDGAEQFGFAFEIKICNACAILAHANVGYDFDRNGKFAGTHLLTIIPAPPQH